MPLSRKPLVLAAHPNSFHSVAFLPVSSCLSSQHLQRGRSLYPNALHFLFPVFSCLEYFCPALIFLISMMPSFHFHFSSERKHCKIHHLGVCGVLLLPLTELVNSTNKIKVMKIQSLLKIQGWTENNLSALLQLDPVFQFRPCQNNRLF